MNTNQHLCLNGSGYLHDVTEENGKTIARINIITHFDLRDSLQDNIWIDCWVQNPVIVHALRNLTQWLHEGCAVFIRFQAAYSSFVTAYAGVTPEDSENIVHLKGRLLTLGSSYLDGEKVLSSTKTTWRRHGSFAIRTLTRAA